MKIFLDDIRNPPDASWTIVRSYEEFVKLVKETPHVITEISFDHDLGMVDNVLLKTGMDATKFFVEHCIDNPNTGMDLEKITVHSSNPPGVENIKGYFKSARDHGIVNTDLVIAR